MKEIDRPIHLKKLDSLVTLDAGWYRCRNNRRVKIFISNFPRILGYVELQGAVWDNTNKIFLQYDSWDYRGFSHNFGNYFDIIARSNIPSNYPDKEKEEAEIKRANEGMRDIFNILRSGTRVTTDATKLLLKDFNNDNFRHRSGSQGCSQHLEQW